MPRSVIRCWSSSFVRYSTLGLCLGVIWLAETAVVAHYSRPSNSQLAQGRQLFEHKWTENDSLAGGGDGLGPVFNASSCVECHFQGSIGGGGTKQVQCSDIRDSADQKGTVASVGDRARVGSATRVAGIGFDRSST